MGMVINRVTDPNWLHIPTVERILTEASHNCKVWPDHYPEAREDFKRIVADTKYNLVNLGIEDGEIKGVSITMLPQDKLFMPQQFMYHCTGRELCAAMIQACVDFVKAAGYTKGWTVNGTGIPDAIWLRAHGLKGRAIGSLIEFSF